MPIVGSAANKVHSGSWFGLPDLGITEWLSGSNRSSQGGSNLFPNAPLKSGVPQVQSKAPDFGPNAVFNPNANAPKPSVLGASTAYGGGGGGQRVAAPASALGISSPTQPIAPGGPSLQDQINSAFDAEQGYLSGLENTARSQADRARAQLQAEMPQLQQQVEGQRSTRNQELGNRETQVRQDYYQGVGQTKQLLSQLNNRNNAMLANQGGYGSSTAAALAESYGRQANQSLGSLQASREAAVASIDNERAKVQNFFDSQLQNLQMNYQRSLGDIENQLQSTLSQISQNRAASAQAKAAAQMSAWQDYAAQKNNIEASIQDFNNQLSMWKQQKDAAVDQATNYALAQTQAVDPTSGLFNVQDAVQFGVGQQSPTQAFAPVRAKARQTNDEEQNVFGQPLATLPMTIRSAFA